MTPEEFAELPEEERRAILTPPPSDLMPGPVQPIWDTPDAE